MNNVVASIGWNIATEVINQMEFTKVWNAVKKQQQQQLLIITVSCLIHLIT